MKFLEGGGWPRNQLIRLWWWSDNPTTILPQFSLPLQCTTIRQMAAPLCHTNKTEIQMAVSATDVCFRLLMTFLVMASAVATSHCISDVSFQREKGNFDPTAPTFFFRSFWNSKLRNTHIRDTNPRAKFGKDRFTGDVRTNTQILAVYSRLPFLPRDAHSASAVLLSSVVRPSVRLSVCDVDVSWAYRLD